MAWGALPALRPGLIKGCALKAYWTETVLINAGCVALVLGLNLFGKNTSNQLPDFAMTQLFFAWSYLHITWSFIVSGANPPWVKRLVGVALIRANGGVLYGEPQASHVDGAQVQRLRCNL